MMRYFIPAFLLAPLFSFAQTLIRNSNVVDVESKKIIAGTDVLVHNGTITAVGKKLTAPAGTTIIDGTGKWLMPGLVDAHVHFFQSGGLYARPDAIDLRKIKPYEKEIAWTHNNMEALLRRYTAAGVTTVVDVGATLNFLRQRDSFRNKWYAPAVYMTGPLLTTYEPEVFKKLGDDEPFYLMKSVDDARAGVRMQLPLKPDFIKIWFIVLDQKNVDSAARALMPMISAVIDEAHKNGLRVAVHATERITAGLATEAGADFLVHGVEDGPADAKLAQLIKNKNVVMSPTLVVAGNYGKLMGDTYHITADDYRYAHPTPLATVHDMAGMKDTARSKAYKAYFKNNAARDKREDSLRSVNLKLMADGGVVLATGTDAGNIGTQHVSSYFDELRAMQASGLSMWQLLQASTINGAKAVGATNFGAVKKGMIADLLLLDKNPLDSITNWKSINRIINKGNVFQPDSLLQRTPVELADAQLAAYNAHNLEAFLEPYADDVEIYELESNKLLAKGKAAMRQQYSFLASIGILHCNLINRMVQDNIVIDHEEIVLAGGRRQYGVAIYETSKGKIRKVWFPR